MTKVQIKSEELTPFGGIFSIMEQFDSTLSSVIDSTLGQRCKSFGYQYSEIIRSLMSIYFCGGSCIEDVTTHLMHHLSIHPTLRTCSSATILRAIKELTQENISYRLVIQRQKRMDGMQDLWEGEYIYRCILTNDYESSEIGRAHV